MNCESAVLSSTLMDSRETERDDARERESFPAGSDGNAGSGEKEMKIPAQCPFLHFQPRKRRAL
jgi:hypothetical protein